MPDEPINDVTYSAVYRHSVDDKRRVPVPFRWRPKDPVEFTILVWAQHQAGTCLRVLDPKQWLRLRADVDAMPPGVAKQTLKRGLGSLCFQSKLDSSGRIALPEEAVIAAEIGNQAVLVGLLDQFEIWNPERYAKVVALDNAHLQEALRMVG